MAPIRLGIIGLSATSSWAVNAHLPYLVQSSKYTITALCNSSVETARAAIKAHSLGDNVAAYGSAEDLAKDDNVDLVVDSIRVDRHYDSLLPVLRAKKDVFCEWPLGKNLKEAEELNALAREKGVKTMIGLQVVQSTVVNQIKEIVELGTIGKVLSTTFHGAAYNGGPQESEAVKYITTRDVGGNLLTIHFMHSFSAILHALGDVASYNSIIETRRPRVEITDKAIADPERKVVDTATRTSPDQFLINGHLTSGALFSYHLRGGKAFSPEEGLVWRIYGEKGEIQVTAGGALLNIGSPDVKIEVNVGDEGKKEVEVEKGEYAELPPPAQNVARLYEAFADGKTDKYLDWNAAVKRHKFLQELLDREADGTQDRAAHYYK